MQNVTLDRYGRGQNAHVVTLGPLTVWFSYRTPIAFRDDRTGEGTIRRQNDWGPTTGRHLGCIGSVSPFIPGEQFEAKLAAALPAMETA